MQLIKDQIDRFIQHIDVMVFRILKYKLFYRQPAQGRHQYLIVKVDLNTLKFL